MKIKIILELREEYADPDHEMGITNVGYEKLLVALERFGYDLPDVERVDE